MMAVQSFGIAALVLLFLSQCVEEAAGRVGGGVEDRGGEESRPNIIVILADDQDDVLDSETYMPILHRVFVEKGTTTKGYVATPVCCPSRSSIVTGKYIHNLGVINNTVSGNCGGIDWIAGPEKDNLGVLMQRAGYQTAYLGKYLNCYGDDEVGGLKRVPPGWNFWSALKGNSKYYNYSLSVDGTVEHHGFDEETDYLPYVLRDKAVKYLDSKLSSQQIDTSAEPFLLFLALPTPHEPADSPEKYSTLWEGLRAPRTPSWNIRAEEPRNWFLRSAGINGLMNETMINYSDIIYRRRVQALQVTDAIISEIETVLNRYENAMEDTFLLYFSDNGYHSGQFGLALDKRLAIETDIRVPFHIRGPGIAENKELKNGYVMNIDITPTLLDIAGASPNWDFFDGISQLEYLKSAASSSSGREAFDYSVRTHFLIEYNGEGSETSPFTTCPAYTGNPAFEGTSCHMVPWNGDESAQFNVPPYYNDEMWCSCQDVRNNTYSCVRTLSITENTNFCIWVSPTSESLIEFYNITSDPWNLVNLAPEMASSAIDSYTQRLQCLQTCAGPTCNSEPPVPPHSGFAY